MKTVFTNGCFDLLHVGHVHLLQFARDQGERLVVAVDSDERIRELKGATRPIIPQEQRMALLQSLRCVDEVLIFHSRAELHEIIEHLRPAVLVKGPPWQAAELESGKLVESWGGQVVIAPEMYEQSTTRIVERIVRLGR